MPYTYDQDINDLAVKPNAVDPFDQLDKTRDQRDKTGEELDAEDKTKTGEVLDARDRTSADYWNGQTTGSRGGRVGTADALDLYGHYAD